MTIKESFKYSGHIYQMWDTNKGCWMKHTDKGDVVNAIIYGDPRGDTFIKTYETVDELNKGMQDIIIEGNTGCDFATTLYAVIKEGKKYTPKIN